MYKFKVQTTVKHGVNGAGQPVMHAVGAIIELTNEEAGPLLACGAICKASAADASAALPMHDPQFAAVVHELAQSWGKPVQPTPPGAALSGAVLSADEVEQFRAWVQQKNTGTVMPDTMAQPLNDAAPVVANHDKEPSPVAAPADEANKAASGKAAKAK